MSQEICRVCRSQGTTEDPLFHPCKCSGSMKYIHQQCLEQWLTVSKKKECEICQYPFSFVPVYADTVPEEISKQDILLFILKKALNSAYYYFRITVVFFLWLIWVPFIAIWTWRLFLTPSRVQIAISTIDPFLRSPNQWIHVLSNPQSWGDPIKMFLWDVVEGLIVVSLGLVCALSVIIIQSYIMANTPRDPQGRLVVPEQVRGEDLFRDGILVENGERNIRPPVAPRPPQEPVQAQPIRQPPAGREIPIPLPRPSQPQQANNNAGNVLDFQQNEEETLRILQELLASKELPLNDSQPLLEEEGTNQVVNVGSSSSTSKPSIPPQTATTALDSKGKGPLISAPVDPTNHLPGPDITDPSPLPRDIQLKEMDKLMGKYTQELRALEQQINRQGGTLQFGSELDSAAAMEERIRKRVAGLSSATAVDDFNNGLGSVQDSILSTRSATLIGKDELRYREFMRDSPGLRSSNILSSSSSSSSTGTSASPLTAPGMTASSSNSSNSGTSGGVSNPSTFVSPSSAHLRRYDGVMPRSAPVVLDPYTRPLSTRHASSPLASSSTIAPDLDIIDDAVMQVDHAQENPEHNLLHNAERVDDIPPQQVPPPPALDANINIAQNNINNNVDENGDDDEEEDMAEINLNINIGGEEGFQLEGNGDFQPILTMIGLQGPWSNLFLHVFLVHFIVFVVTGVFVWFPCLLGRGFVYFLTDLYAPFVEWVISLAWSGVVRFSDVILDPIADGLAAFLVWSVQTFELQDIISLLGPHEVDNATNATVSSLSSSVSNSILSTTANASASNLSDAVVTKVMNVTSTNVSSNLTSAVMVSPLLALINNATSPVLQEEVVEQVMNKTVQSSSIGGMFGPNLSDHFMWLITGYSVIGFVIFAVLVRTRLIQHPYIMSFKNMLRTVANYGYWIFKFIVCILLETVLFACYCGILIDTLSQPLFSAKEFLKPRIALFQAHPFVFLMIYWTLGMMFMFSVYKYVMLLRENVRPGVFFFLRDPNDPQNNIFNETMQKPLSYQLKKIWNGIWLYSCLALGSVGLAVGILWIISWILQIFGVGSFGPLKVLPFRHEVDDQIVVLPVVLLALSYVFPGFIQSLGITTAMRNGIVSWLSFITKKLRLSDFIYGDHRVEEESDYEDNDTLEPDHDDDHDDQQENPPVVIRHMTIDPNRSRLRNRHRRHLAVGRQVTAPIQTLVEEEDGVVRAMSELDNEEWEDELDENQSHRIISSQNPEEHLQEEGSSQQAELPGPSPRKVRSREFRYMRVPNRDIQPLGPDEKILIPMKDDDPVFGRPDESPEEVLVNWRKVYVPERFRMRVRGLILSQSVAISFVMAMAIFVIIVPGRLFFFAVDKYTQFRIELPFTVFESAMVQRSDLAMHDIYSLMAGIFICRAFYSIYKAVVALFWIPLMRRNAIRRKSSGAVDSPLRLNINTNVAGNDTHNAQQHQDGTHSPDTSSIVNKAWSRYLRRRLRYSIRLLIWTIFGVLVCPLLAGHTFQFCVLSPLKYNLEKTRPTLLILWVIGLALFKLGQVIISNGPDSRARRLLIRMRQDGIVRLNMRWVLRYSALFVLTCVFVQVTSFGLQHAVTFLSMNESSELVSDRASVYVVAFASIILFGLRLISLFQGGENRGTRNVHQDTWSIWADQMRNEQYLVGRKLQNFDESQTSSTSGLTSPVH